MHDSMTLYINRFAENIAEKMIQTDTILNVAACHQDMHVSKIFCFFQLFFVYYIFY